MAAKDKPVTPVSDELQKPQFPEDKHDASYDNDSEGWVRGKGQHPYFDKSKPRR